MADDLAKSRNAANEPLNACPQGLSLKARIANRLDQRFPSNLLASFGHVRHNSAVSPVLSILGAPACHEAVTRAG